MSRDSRTELDYEGQHGVVVVVRRISEERTRVVRTTYVSIDARIRSTRTRIEESTFGVAAMSRHASADG